MHISFSFSKYGNSFMNKLSIKEYYKLNHKGGVVMMNPYWYYPTQAIDLPIAYSKEKKHFNEPNEYLRPCVREEKYCDYFNLGDSAPDFTLEGIVNGQPRKVSLSDYRGKWVLLFFYGSDFTFV